MIRHCMYERPVTESEYQIRVPTAHTSAFTKIVAAIRQLLLIESHEKGRSRPPHVTGKGGCDEGKGYGRRQCRSERSNMFGNLGDGLVEE